MRVTKIVPIALCLALMALFTVSCDKEQPIVEEDLNGFDTQADDLITLQLSDNLFHYYTPEKRGWSDTEEIDQGGVVHKYFDRLPTEEEIMQQDLEGFEVEKTDDGIVIRPEGTGKRSANKKFQFIIGGGEIHTMRVLTDAGYCTMGTWAGSVTLVINANFLACNGDLDNCTDNRIYLASKVYNSSCRIATLRYIDASGVIKDTDQVGFKTSWWKPYRIASDTNTPSNSEHYIIPFAGPCSGFGDRFCS